MKKEPVKFKTLQNAVDGIMLMDFNRVLEYRIIYNHVSGESPEYWTVKRKIMSMNAFGQTQWGWLET